MIKFSLKTLFFTKMASKTARESSIGDFEINFDDHNYAVSLGRQYLDQIDDLGQLIEITQSRLKVIFARDKISMFRSKTPNARRRMVGAQATEAAKAILEAKDSLGTVGDSTDGGSSKVSDDHKGGAEKVETKPEEILEYEKYMSELLGFPVKIFNEKEFYGIDRHGNSRADRFEALKILDIKPRGSVFYRTRDFIIDEITSDCMIYLQRRSREPINPVDLLQIPIPPSTSPPPPSDTTPSLNPEL